MKLWFIFNKKGVTEIIILKIDFKDPLLYCSVFLKNYNEFTIDNRVNAY